GFRFDPRPTGAYTLTVTVRDNALPDGNPKTVVIPFIIDMTPPTVELRSHRFEEQLTDGALITGTVADDHAAVVSVEYAFVDATTALATGEPLLNLALNDLPQTVLFANTGISQTQIFCLGESCPTSGANGNDGRAATFDGNNDLLRTFETLDLPESGLTTSLWFKTTCADCGLMSITQGDFPTIVAHDRDLFLSGGSVCSSVLIGGTRDLRCTPNANYNDNQWHQVVHTLGSGGNALYLDGQLAVSSPTTASTFATQDGLLIGYAAAATLPFLNGSLDEITIFNRALTGNSVAALYRQWQPVTVNGNQWSFTVPEGIEGYMQIDMRATDSIGNRIESRGDWPQFRGPVDTKAPTFDVTAAYRGSGSSAQTIYSATVQDLNLTTDNYTFICPLSGDQLRYQASAAQLAFTGNGVSNQLSGIDAQCTSSGFQSSLVAANACDTYGHCAAAIPPQAIAYIGTYENRTLPYGSLPNAIERTNLSDPANRARLIERPGRQIVDIAVDELHGKLYWAEIVEGNGGQPGGVWRANLDGSNIEQLVSGLTPYAAEALQIALDPAGNKLYWTKGVELWGANLDGTLPQVIYSIPPDPGFANGGLAAMAIGDVAIDPVNGRLYLSELRQRGNLAEYNSGIRTFAPIYAHTLIVTTDLNGQTPSFVAGVGPGCTYANFYQNKGYGVGAGQDPTNCLLAAPYGFDVESLTVSDGVLYWSAIDADQINSGVYGRAPRQAAFTVAPLALPGNNRGLRLTPLPQLYVNPISGGVFVGLGSDIVRGERDGAFTRFTRFVDTTPVTPGSVQRSSLLSAMTVLQSAQELQTDTDLAVGITSPALVLVDGNTGRYDITLRNDAALAADATVVTLALPDGASYAGSSVACADGGATVTCDFGRMAPLTQQSLTISFTIATATVRDLTATVSATSATAERNPTNNSASHTTITAAPTLAALPGIPYIYYGDTERLTRVGLFDSYGVEPLFMDANLSGSTLAADLVRNRVYIVTAAGKLVAVDPDGGNRVEIADTNPNTIDAQGRNRVAVDESTGRVYWSEINTIALTTIKSANPDGSDLQTIIGDIRDQRGLVVDPVRGKLLWVGTDLARRQELIFAANLDGSELALLYTAPEGAQIRYLALDPYAQKLYWIDPAAEDGGTLFWADADGGRLAVLNPYLNRNAAGLVVRPQENALYYVTGAELYRAELNG
ncbi:MAG: hypothetical protein KDE58_27250, partial [Caldilineaceae bacterium]|nr:hypothetical protein [Caldilineaceae bacterium]